MVTRGKILALSISAETGVPKTNVSEAHLSAGWGMDGDAHAGRWHRQVSLLAIESIAKIRALGLDVQPGDFAENITTQGVDLTVLTIGDRILCGECALEITQIGKECHAPCAIFARVGDCVMPREGIFARVLHGGVLHTGDEFEIVQLVHKGDSLVLNSAGKG